MVHESRKPYIVSDTYGVHSDVLERREESERGSERRGDTIMQG